MSFPIKEYSGRQLEPTDLELSLTSNKAVSGKQFPVYKEPQLDRRSRGMLLGKRHVCGPATSLAINMTKLMQNGEHIPGNRSLYM